MNDERPSADAAQPSKRRRRRRLPPPRIAWPSGGGVSSLSEVSVSNSNLDAAMSIAASSSSLMRSSATSIFSTRDNASRRMKTNSASTTANITSSSSNNNQLWVDKHKPTCSKSLCIAPKKVKEVTEWLVQSLRSSVSSSVSTSTMLAPSPKLLVLVGSPGIGKSTIVEVLAQELKLRILKWDDVHSNDFDHKSVVGISYESQLTSFRDFLNSAAFQYQSCEGVPNASCGGGGGVSSKGSIVMIDGTPNLHSPQSEEQFRNIMNEYMQKTQTPTIFIMSDVMEGKHKPGDLERYFDPNVLYSPYYTTIMQINSVTKSKMKTCLKEIMKREGACSGNAGDVGLLLEELHLYSGGDLRHAIMNLQFRANNNGVSSTTKGRGRNRIKEKAGTGSVSGGIVNHQRDTKLSTFHALGKLLYAKRVDANDENTMGLNKNSKGGNSTALYESYHDCQWNKDRRPPLQFQPERVLEEGDIGIDGALSFLHGHAHDFFTDITDIGIAYERFSDAAYFMKDAYSGASSKDTNSSYPQDYAISLASRAVGDANKHPAPSKFRQLTAPRIYEVMRKKRKNEGTMEQICKRLSYRGHHLSMQVNTSLEAFVADDMPYLKKIIPEEVSTLDSNLYSSYSSFVAIDGDDVDFSKNQLAVELEQQKMILARDDIVNSSDSESEEDAKKVVSSLAPITSSQRSIVSQDSNSTSTSTKNGRTFGSGRKIRESDIIVID